MIPEQTSTSQLALGWIGTGIMGASMCGHLLEQGHGMTVHSRTRAKAADLERRGARWMATPRAVAEASDIVFTMVGFPDDVRQVYLSDEGILEGARPGAVFVDMTTTQPSLAVEIAEAARGRGFDAVDAPVSGGDVGAKNATLSIMVGGSDQAVARVRPLLERMGKTIIHQGGPGAGQHTKMCNQVVIAGTTIGVCESLLYAYRAGLDPVVVLQSIRGGAAGCWTLENLAPRVLKGDFAPGFLVDHFVKDMAIALDEARRLRLALPGLALVHQLYVALQAQGHGRRGTHALMLALQQLSPAQE
jgi:3-hydroxyisobutyrate dehydrogenase